MKLLEEDDQPEVFDKLWKDKAKKIMKKRPFGVFASYKLKPVIVKGGDDLRQEMIAM